MVALPHDPALIRAHQAFAWKLSEQDVKSQGAIFLGTDRAEIITETLGWPRWESTVVDDAHFITAGAADFAITSEQYYLLVDPANHVLATTLFPTADGPHVPNGPVAMPLAWTKYYGVGRVFYCSIGHEPTNLQQPEVQHLCVRGILWAARADD